MSNELGIPERDREHILLAIDTYYKENVTYFASTVSLDDGPASVVVVQRMETESSYHGVALALYLSLAKLAKDTQALGGESLAEMECKLDIALVEDRSKYGSSLDGLLKSCIKMFNDVLNGVVDLDGVENEFKVRTNYIGKYGDVKAKIVYCLIALSKMYVNKIQLNYKQIPLKDPVFALGRDTLSMLWDNEKKHRNKKQLAGVNLMDVMDRLN